MAQQIKWYNKSFIDIDNPDPTITITDSTAIDNGQSYVDFLRNRKNSSGWSTTGSNDAANTQIDIDLVDDYSVDRILLIRHNLKAFTIQYFNGTSYVDFSTAINESANTQTTNEFTFDAVTTSQIRIIITGTQVADADKLISQLIITSAIGQFTGWPQILNPTYGRNKRTSRLLSGKTLVTTQTGFFKCSLSVENWNIDNDLSILEEIYFSVNGVLMWLNAGDDTQFSRTNISYRGEDIFLVKPTNEYIPQFYKSYYRSGLKIKVDIQEVVR